MVDPTILRAPVIDGRAETCLGVVRLAPVQVGRERDGVTWWTWTLTAEIGILEPKGTMTTKALAIEHADRVLRAILAVGVRRAAAVVLAKHQELDEAGCSTEVHAAMRETHDALIADHNALGGEAGPSPIAEAEARGERRGIERAANELATHADDASVIRNHDDAVRARAERTDRLRWAEKLRKLAAEVKP